MIRTHKGYLTTRKFIAKFSNELNTIPNDGTPKNQALREALQSRIDEFTDKIREYDSLSRGNFDFEWLNRIAEIPYMIIRCRIALGLTQKALGERIGVVEQQIQRWESMDYQNTSFGTVLVIIDALRETYKKR